MDKVLNKDHVITLANIQVQDKDKDPGKALLYPLEFSTVISQLDWITTDEHGRQHGEPLLTLAPIGDASDTGDFVAEVIRLLHATGQDYALLADSDGDYWYLSASGRYDYAGRLQVSAYQPRIGDGDYMTVGGTYYQLKQGLTDNQGFRKDQ